jgi:hypothetical protein
MQVNNIDFKFCPVCASQQLTIIPQDDNGKLITVFDKSMDMYGEIIEVKCADCGSEVCIG